MRFLSSHFGQAYPKLEHSELDQGVFLRADSLARSTIVVGAYLTVQDAVHVRSLSELDLIVRLRRGVLYGRGSGDEKGITRFIYFECGK